MEYFVVDVESRKIIIPEGITHIGVKGDDETRTLNFKMPTTYKELDLSGYEAKVHYENAAGEENFALAENKEVDGENMTFQWKVGGDVYVKEGKMYFWLCLESKSSLSGLSLNKWHTTKASLEVLDGGCVGDETLNRNPSLVDQILIRLADVEAQAEANGAEKISEAFATQGKEAILTEKTTLTVGEDIAVGDVISYSWESGADLTISIKKKSDDGLTLTESKWINGIYEGSDSLTVEEGYTSIGFPAGLTLSYPRYPKVKELADEDYLVIGTADGAKKISFADLKAQIGGSVSVAELPAAEGVGF